MSFDFGNRMAPEAFFRKGDPMEEFDPLDDEWGSYEGDCQGCDTYGRVNDLSLCKDCASKLERDLIRQRDWDYSFTAFALPADTREKLREDVIKRYGPELELIAHPGSKAKRSRRSRRR